MARHRLLLTEDYHGVVKEVTSGSRDDDRVTIAYEGNDGEIVEQTYERDQFIGETLPAVGDSLVVSVSVMGVDESVKATLPEESSREIDRIYEKYKNVTENDIRKILEPP